jgi:hypothetical protein
MYEKDELDEALDWIDYHGDVTFRLRQCVDGTRLEVVAWNEPNRKDLNVVEFAFAFWFPGLSEVRRFGCFRSPEQLVTLARMALIAAEQLERLRAATQDSNERDEEDDDEVF